MPGSRLPEPPRTALLVIHMQKDFALKGFALPEGAVEIVPRVAEQVTAARQASVSATFTMEQHRPNMSDFGIELEFEPPHRLEGSEGTELVDSLRPSPGNCVVQVKRRYDASLETDLDTAIRSLGRPQLLVASMCTDLCVSITARHARSPTTGHSWQPTAVLAPRRAIMRQPSSVWGMCSPTLSTASRQWTSSRAQAQGSDLPKLRSIGLHCPR